MADLAWMQEWGRPGYDGKIVSGAGPRTIEGLGEQWAACSRRGVIVAVRGSHGFRPWSPPSEGVAATVAALFTTQAPDAAVPFTALLEWLDDPLYRGRLCGVPIDRDLLASALRHLTAETVDLVAIRPHPDVPAVSVRAPDWRAMIAALRIEPKDRDAWEGVSVFPAADQKRRSA